MTAANGKQYDDADLQRFFSYHSPAGKPGMAELHETVRAECLRLARVLNQVCPQSVDRDEAIKRLRETMMWANASLACMTQETWDDHYAGRERHREVLHVDANPPHKRP
jgi:hypothetical protein